MSRSSTASAGRSCVSRFLTLSEALSDRASEEKYGISKFSCDDELSRFKVWAGNIGALQDAQFSSSLSRRLQNAPKVETTIQGMLNRLNETLQDGTHVYSSVPEVSAESIVVIDIVNGTRKNRTGLVDLPHDNEPPEDKSLEALDNTKVESRSEILELWDSVGSTITGLYRISKVIRKATPRDRYEKAINSKDPLENCYDIAHVGEKFRHKLGNQESRWLRERLGNAITKRRQFLRYSRDHHEKISRERQVLSTRDVASKPLSEVRDAPVRSLAPHPQEETVSHRAPTTIPSTKASTLVPAQIQQIHPIPDDEQSYAPSMATSMPEDEEGVMTVIPLEQVSQGRRQFECPYCHDILTLRNQKSWRYGSSWILHR